MLSVSSGKRPQKPQRRQQKRGLQKLLGDTAAGLLSEAVQQLERH